MLCAHLSISTKGKSPNRYKSGNYIYLRGSRPLTIHKTAPDHTLRPFSILKWEHFFIVQPCVLYTFTLPKILTHHKNDTCSFPTHPATIIGFPPSQFRTNASTWWRGRYWSDSQQYYLWKRSRKIIRTRSSICNLLFFCLLHIGWLLIQYRERYYFII